MSNIGIECSDKDDDNSPKIKIPIEWTRDIKTLNYAIDVLKFLKKFKQGRVVSSRSGLRNKLRYYILGYIHVSDVEAVCKDGEKTDKQS